MDKVYLVLAIKNSADIEACELFLNEDLALDRAYDVATDIRANHNDNNTAAWLNALPAKETLDDGSNRWIFLETSKQYVAVHLLPVNDAKLGFVKFGDSPAATGTISLVQNKPLPGFTDTTKVGGILNDRIIYLDLQVTQNDRYKKTSPGGFSTSGKAINLAVLLVAPRDVLPTKDLTEAQRNALTKARINHITDYACNWSSGLRWSRTHVEMYLNQNSEFAKPIIDSECEFLDELREQAIRDTEDYDDESSSSSEDEY